MNSHLSPKTIEAFLERRLSVSELLEVDDHLAQCDACARDAAKAPSAEKANAAIERGLADTHLELPEIESYVAGELAESQMTSFGLHIQQCKFCKDAVNDIKILRSELDPPRMSVADPYAPKWYRLLRGPVLAAGAVVIILAALGMWWIATRPDPVTVEPSVVATNSSDPTQAVPDQSASALPGVSEGDATVADAIASLKDDGGEMRVLADGTLTGPVPAEFEKRVKDALRNRALSIPSDVRDLKGVTGVLLGSGTGVPFAIIDPIGKVVETTTPRMVWKPFPGTAYYRVEIFDDRFEPVASSGDVRGTSWQLDKPLSQGRLYSWQVTAIHRDTETKSPEPPAPEARFRIVDAKSRSEIAKLRQSGTRSHLLFGIAYANAGLLDKAERELQELLKANPRSPIVRELLAKVRAAR